MSAFEGISTFLEAPIILLFTKNDVFEENLKIQPFSDFFPETAGITDSAWLRTYIAASFRSLDKRPSRKLYCYFVTATDPENFREVFEQIELNIFK